MAPPSPLRQLLYLGGMTRADGDDRLWLQGVLTSSSKRKLGFLLALPNAAIMVGAGFVLLVLTGEVLGLMSFVAGAALVLVAGVGIPWITRRRAANLARKNSLAQP